MVMLPEGFCIDSTEVTQEQYGTWLASQPSTDGQPHYCAWNDDFFPDLYCLDSDEVCRYGDCGNHPQVCVDWCDAYAYCKAVGKRLCGKIGGGSLGGDSDFADVDASQWFDACTSGGQQATNSGCNFGDTTVPVASMTGCQSTVDGYGGVYDLTGNVWEWDDSCKTTMGLSDYCHLRGGGFSSFTQDRCDENYITNRSAHSTDLGFRCCSSP